MQTSNETPRSLIAWDEIKKSTEIDFEHEYVRSPPPVPMGIPSLDGRLGGGIPTSTFTVIAGEPGTGKSAMACVAAYYAALSGRYAVYYSFEMPTTMVISRLLSIHTKCIRDNARSKGVPYEQWMEQVFWSSTRKAPGTRRVTDDEVEAYLRDYGNSDSVLVAYRNFHESVYNRIAVMETMPDIEFVCQNVATLAVSGLPILPIVDYVQLGAHGDAKEYERLSTASRLLQQTCKAYRVPMIVISSMRNVGKDERKEAPTLSMLRGSGNIGYDAGTVIMLQRDVKREKEMIDQEGEHMLGTKKPIFAHIIKNRVGPSSISVPLMFYGGMNHFE